MKIKDTDGQVYEIKGGELREVQAPIADYYLVLNTLPKTEGDADGGLICRPGSITPKTFEKRRWLVSIKDRAIGCRKFDETNFAKIVRAARKKLVRKTDKKPAKKGKK